MKKTINIILLLLLVAVRATACTSFVISGRITKDGRPMIFKNRDTPELNNHLVVKHGERFTFVAVADDKDKEVENVWQGYNERGFALVETDAYNLNGHEQSKVSHDGSVLRRALEVCETLEDFETLLDTLPKPLYMNSNIGVIDAQGGAAYYEVGNKGYVKYDANDPKVAPQGYLLRTNFGMSGDRSMDQGIERYLAISDIILRDVFSGELEAADLIRSIPRNLRHGLTHIDLRDYEPATDEEQVMVHFTDYIPRYLTASSTLIQGVKAGEDPSHLVAWNFIGSPLTTVAVPLMGTDHLPKVELGDENNHSLLCQQGLKRKEKLFPYVKGNGRNYMDLAQLINKQGTGILQRVMRQENEIFAKALPVIDAVRNDEPSAWKQLHQLYDWIDQQQSAELP